MYVAAVTKDTNNLRGAIRGNPWPIRVHPCSSVFQRFTPRQSAFAPYRAPGIGLGAASGATAITLLKAIR